VAKGRRNRPALGTYNNNSSIHGAYAARFGEAGGNDVTVATLQPPHEGEARGEGPELRAFVEEAGDGFGSHGIGEESL